MAMRGHVQAACSCAAMACSQKNNAHAGAAGVPPHMQWFSTAKPASPGTMYLCLSGHAVHAVVLDCRVSATWSRSAQQAQHPVLGHALGQPANNSGGQGFGPG